MNRTNLTKLILHNNFVQILNQLLNGSNSAYINELDFENNLV